MKIRRVVPNIASSHLEESREFYTSIFGFHVAMAMGSMMTLVSPDNETAQVSIIGREKGPSDMKITLTIEVADVDDVHRRAASRGLKMLQALRNEPWGIRHFVVVDPNGIELNVMSHLPGEKGQSRKEQKSQ